MCCTIWYHLYNLKNLKNFHGGVLLLVKLQDCNFTKINTPSLVFFNFLKLFKWYKIAQHSYVQCVQWKFFKIQTILNNIWIKKYGYKFVSIFINCGKVKMFFIIYFRPWVFTFSAGFIKQASFFWWRVNWYLVFLWDYACYFIPTTVFMVCIFHSMITTRLIGSGLILLLNDLVALLFMTIFDVGN